MKQLSLTSTSAVRGLGPVWTTLILGGALAVSLGGCASEPESHIVSAPPPAAPTLGVGAVAAPAPAPMVVTTTTAGTAATAPAVNTIVITQAAPPPPPPEAVSARPSEQHRWVPGFWTWRNNRYEWMAGHWEMPPRTSAVWVAPRWETENGAFRFYEGYWN